eukprot:11191174-Lingulodinium_polyedra.AAC.1
MRGASAAFGVVAPVPSRLTGGGLYFARARRRRPMFTRGKHKTLRVVPGRSLDQVTGGLGRSSSCQEEAGESCCQG